MNGVIENIVNGKADMKTLLTPKNIAEKLNLSISTVYYYAKNGTLPELHIGNKIRFDPDEIENYIKNLKKEGDFVFEED